MTPDVQMDETTDLIEKARGGSREAFSSLVRQFQSRVRAYLAAYLRDREVVDDLAQDVFLGAYRSLHAYRGQSTFGAWLLAIARNVAVSHLRDRVRRRSHEGGPAHSLLGRLLAERVQAEVAEPSVEEREILALEQCLDSLPRHSADLVQEHYFEGRSAADIARRTGRKDGTVRVTLVRIRQALRRCLRSRARTSEIHL